LIDAMPNMISKTTEAGRKWSAAIREVEGLEGWLTESHHDEHYWDDVAEAAVSAVGLEPKEEVGVAALRTVLAVTFPSAPPQSNDGLYLDRLGVRLALIAQKTLTR
jgi:hypothetical protein